MAYPGRSVKPSRGGTASSDWTECRGLCDFDLNFLLSLPISFLSFKFSSAKPNTRGWRWNWWSWSGSSSATSTTVTLPACRAVQPMEPRPLHDLPRSQRCVCLTALPPLIAAASPTSYYAKKVARKGWLPVLQWARANGCLWDHWTCAVAAGHLELLPWTRANGCPWDTCNAARKGRLEVLKWAPANGCEWDSCTCAARSGHLEVLPWLRANGCLWDSETCALAGNLELLQWAWANGMR